jgi:IS30 family transposase
LPGGGVEVDLRAVCPETIYGWIYRAAQKAGRLWRYLTRAHARRRKRHARASRDKIAEKTPISLTTPTPGKRRAIGKLTSSFANGPARLWCCTNARPGSP